MSLTKTPPELIFQICSYLVPKSIFPSGKPFSDWGREVRSEMWSSTRDLGDFHSLRETCRELHQIIPRYPENLYLYNPGLKKIQAVLHHSSIRILSIFETFSMRNDNEEISGLRNGTETHLDQTIRVISSDDVDPVNTSIHSLRMLCFDESGTTFNRLLDRSHGLKSLHYELRDHTISLAERESFLRETIRKISSTKIETLVLTLQRANDSWDWGNGLTQTISLKSLGTLTTLKISSFLLLGSVGHLRYDKEVYQTLPSSIVDLEVYFDRGIKYPFIAEPLYNPSDRTSPERPEWLFQLLEKKLDYTPKLERIRIVSDEEYDHLNDSYMWKNGFVPYSQDWVMSDGKKKWKPPIELILAFEKAGACFGLYIQPDVCFRLKIPGIQWFKDTWESKWDEDPEGEGVEEIGKAADDRDEQVPLDEEFMNYEYDGDYSDIAKTSDCENEEISQVDKLEEDGDSDWLEQEDSDGK